MAVEPTDPFEKASDAETVPVRVVWPEPRKSRMGVVLALLALNLLATGTLAARVLVNPSWEYKVEFFTEGTIGPSLNERGGEGWELVDIRRANDGTGAGAAWGAEVVLRRRR